MRLLRSRLTLRQNIWADTDAAFVCSNKRGNRDIEDALAIAVVSKVLPNVVWVLQCDGALGVSGGLDSKACHRQM